MEDQPPPPPPPPAQGEGGAAAAAATRRWTCEACGCNTNTSENSSCSICGTSNSGPSLLRRASNARNSASWFARGVLGRGVGGGRGGGLNDDLVVGNLDDEAADLWESVVDDVEMAGSNLSSYHHHADAAAAAAAAAASASSMEAFAMEVSGMASAARRSMESRRQQREQSAAIMESGRQRFLEAARAFSQASREIQRDNHSLVAAAAAAARGVSQPAAASAAEAPPVSLVPPAELLELATRNASRYQPRWINPANLAAAGGRSVRGISSGSSSASTVGTGIQVSEGEGQNLAQLLPSAGGGGEGRAVRAEQPFPRPERETPTAASFFARSQSSPVSSSSPSLSSSPISGAGAAPPAASSHVRASSGGAGTDEKGRRQVFGFRVAFDHPTVEDGESMGGCYLVGVTTSSFTAYGEQSALSQSPFFWGIEDGGNKYEGSRYHHHHPSASSSSAAAQDGRISSGAITNRRLSASYAMDLESSAHDVPFNDANVLFGSKDVVTVVCDLENRTLTFWRNETLLGTLVSNLPRSTGAAGNQLFPVAVPFNCGVAVAITGLDGDPLPILRTFASDWRKSQQEKEDAIRLALQQQRALLISPTATIPCAAGDEEENSSALPRIMTPQLLDVLKQIFALYTTTHQGANNNPTSNDDDDECMKLDDDANNLDMTLDHCAATRLFYRCGLKLKTATPSKTQERVTLQDFLILIDKILLEDEQNVRLHAGKKPPPPTMGLGGRSNRDVQRGDKVELVEGYEKFGDASGGPLRPGDRGTVVELQNGPSGERRSIRVLYSGRRWWYQPQAVLSERSGLIESPGVWFLRGLLRAHGYDHATLQPLSGKPVRSSECQVGDLVVPASVADDADKCATCFGRIAVDTSATPSLTSSSSATAHGSSSSSTTVAVEFVGHAFAEAVKLQPISTINSSVLETRRVLDHRLVYGPPSLYGRVATEEEEESTQEPESRQKVRDDDDDDGMNLDEDEDAKESDEELDLDDECLAPESVSDKVQSDITGVARLDGHAIDSISKECKKSPESLASVFSSGLPEALLSATDVAERQMNSLEPREDLSERISAIGSLTMFIADQLFSEKPHTCSKPEAESAASDSQESNTHAPGQAASSPGSLISRSSASRPMMNAGRRQTVRDAIARRDEERGRAAQGLVASLQQRRSMLMSLMSRARRANVNALEELDASASSALARELSQIASPAGFNMGGDFPNAMDGSWDEVAALAGNFPDGMSYSADDQMPELVGRGGSSRESERSISDQQEPSASYLDSILRNGSTTALTNSSRSKPTTGASQFVFFQQLIGTGMMTNNVKWIKGSIESLVKKTSQRSHSMLRNAVDEEGTPLLHLCISFGCSPDIVNCLLGCGAPATMADVKKAIETDQPKVLTLLLRHTSLPDDIDPSQCSVEVTAVLARAKRRQDQLDKKMRETAGSFMVQMLRRLLSLGLLSRKHRSPLLDNVSRSISGILVGNVLLRALQKTQKVAPGNADDDPDSQEDTSSGRFTVDENFSAYSARGLFGSLPRSILSEAFLIDVDRATTLLLLIEDYLCSKDMSDSAAGLTALASILSHFPALCTCSEMSRYGMSDLVNLHDTLASHRWEEILSRQLKSDLQLDSADTEPVQVATTSCVLCPKKHTAVLHITRHSSFRCDLCGCGVERGRPMHGCRECDWDGCEECTDKAESGLVKCAAIREVSSDCRKLLNGEVKTGEDDERSIDIAKKLSSQVSVSELESMSMRLLEQDVEAIRDLARMLRTPGRLSIHQFYTRVLPALHAACVARSPESGGAILAAGSGHRNKKAKVVGSHHGDLDESCSQSPELRLSFCRELVRAMILEFEEIPPTRANDDGPLRGSSAISDHESDGGEDGDDDGQNDESPNISEREIAFFAESSELLRRLQQVLSLYESVTIGPTLYEKKSPPGGGDLQALTKPLEIHLKPSSFEETLPSPFSLVVHAEPLIPVADLQLHVLRCCSSLDPSYASFCESLAHEKAIIVERSTQDKNGCWEFAQVTDYDEVSGAHTVRYASSFKRGQDCRTLQFRQGTDVTSIFAFSGREANLCLVVREYFVLQRTSSGKAKSSSPARAARTSGLTPKFPSDGSPGAGTRVERSHPDGKTWEACTMLPSSGEKNDSGFTLVSDDGIVYYGLGSGSIRISGIPVDVSADDDPNARRARRRRDAGDALNRAFPFLARQRSDIRESEDPPRTIGALTRSWSALSLVDKLKPLELFPIKETNPHRGQNPEHDVLALKCKLDDVELQLVASQLESRPELIVRFSLDEKLPGVEMSDTGSTTLVNALHRLHARKPGGSELQLFGTHRLYFSITAGTSPSRATLETIQSLRQAVPPFPDVALTDTAMVAEESVGWTQNSERRSRKLSSRSLGSEEEEITTGICEGLDEICVQCMEVVSVLSEFAGDSSSPRDRDRKCSVFSNGTLSRKLIDNLNDPISVVAGALPDWVVTAPVFAPRVFSYESRRTLLERVAFGISRSILKQQEAKVNVGRLRQRMASLRGRAVELVGEAFSGGAEDPTALQLQADELYGMEEALAARVRAAFRAMKWKEHSLEVAKAAVHRETLLLDAAAIMERYAADETVNRRRLEIRFEGESGFDAASGDEAGVTRGFYADVAELLLSSETVAGVYCSSNCTEVAAAASLSKAQPMDVDESQKEASKLPLWIPDMDSSAQVVIPTPRSDPRSGLGVFPRPLPRYHPQMQEVLEKFRFMGRLFAAAMRDGFMFPLPLSSAFLKLVQNGGTTDVATAETLLTTNDLPRSGFLGGEIHAAEVHICRALDKLDAADPPRHEKQRRYDEIANDKNFARNALGKSYDCSFEDYFQDRTFVDPLDPAQDENAAPLCPKGHKLSVTVYNVREWVKLAKRFFLFDGVIAQALSFRQGVEDFFPVDYLRLFTAEELQRDVCGVGDNVENWDESAVRRIFKLDGGKGAAEALVAVAAIGGEGGAALSRRFGPSSPTITFLVKALLEGSPKQRRQFLSFVTSVPIVTPGRIEVVPIVSPSGEFLPMRDPACLPRANTCARRLYLPKFDDYASFSQVLWAVVREESKFKGFYEWRGG